METITDMVNRLSKTQRDQTGGAEVVQGAVDEIRTISLDQGAKLGELEQAIAKLSHEARLLASELGRFKV